MSNYSLSVSAVSAVYICLVGASSFQKIQDRRTSGIEISDSLPRDFVSSVGTPLPAGFHSTNVSMTFLSSSSLTWKIAKGIPLTGNPNDPPGSAVYSMFLLSANPKSDNSFYFPKLSTYQPLHTNYNKDKPTILPITLIGTDRDYSVNIMDKGTFPSLISTYSLSGKLPIFGY